MIRYKFHQEESSLGSLLRPIADVVLEYQENKIEVPMYIDSGADISMIPFRLGKALGFRQRPSDVIYEVKGITGGGVPYKLRNLYFIFNEGKIKGRVAWALIEEIPILLGRMDVFDKFIIIFNEKQRTIDFEEIKENK